MGELCISLIIVPTSQLHNMMTYLQCLQIQGWDFLYVEEKTGFPMYTLEVWTEEKYQPLTEIEREEAVMLTVSQMQIKCLIEGLSCIHLHNKKGRQKSRRKR